VKIYLKQNVFDAAVARVCRVFAEFPTVVVCFSGGKDSTVILNLALMVARELGRLPLKVFWLDQEAEWRHVVEYQRSVMNRPDVEPLWFQGPFRLFNATTTGEDPWLHCWREGDTWMRPKEQNSIHENKCGTDRFYELFEAFFRTYFADRTIAKLGGVRCEESPARMQGLTGFATYKDITWGRVDDKKRGHFVFYPIYDWSYSDVWKAIHEHGWPYCKLYDFMYQYGIPVREMRVSNVHHETAVHNLRFLQEIEPDTWNRVTERLGSTNAVARARELYRVPEELPYMFATWREYRDHLLENLIDVAEVRDTFRKQFKLWDRRFRTDDPAIELALMKAEVKAMLVNDFEGTTIGNFAATNPSWARGWRSRDGKPIRSKA